MKFGFICTFGSKEPIFSEFQLHLCPNDSLLLLRGEKGEKFVHLREKEDDKFLVSFKVSLTLKPFRLLNHYLPYLISKPIILLFYNETGYI